jgi:hypothetical protein
MLTSMNQVYLTELGKKYTKRENVLENILPLIALQLNYIFFPFQQAVVAHLIVLIAEATIGGLFLVACYKRLKRHHSDIIPAMASLTSIAPSSHSQPVIVHVNGKIPSSFQHASTVASTPLKRGYSLEDLIIDEADDEDDVSISGKTGQFQRRMSLDSKNNLLNLTNSLI